MHPELYPQERTVDISTVEETELKSGCAYTQNMRPKINVKQQEMAVKIRYKKALDLSRASADATDIPKTPTDIKTKSMKRRK